MWIYSLPNKSKKCVVCVSYWSMYTWVYFDRRGGVNHNNSESYMIFHIWMKFIFSTCACTMDVQVFFVCWTSKFKQYRLYCFWNFQFQGRKFPSKQCPHTHGLLLSLLLLVLTLPINIPYFEFFMNWCIPTSYMLRLISLLLMQSLRFRQSEILKGNNIGQKWKLHSLLELH